MKFNRRIVIMALIAVFCGHLGHGAELIDVTASVDKQTAYVGDLIEYTIIITYDSTLQLTPPAAGANLGGFEVKEYEFGDEEKSDDGRRRQAIKFELRTFTTGDYVIPGLPIEYMMPDSTLKYISADPIKIFIKSLLAEGAAVDSLEPRPLKGQSSLAGSPRTLRLIMGAGILVVIGAAIYYFLRRRKKAPKAPYIDPRPSWEIAYADLAVLKNKGLLGQGEIKQFYFELSEIMKKFLGRKFDFNAIDMTTTEIGDTLVGRSLDDGLHGDIVAFFEFADLVKFAKFIPPADRPETDWETAYELVSRSKDLIVSAPVEIEPEPVPVTTAAGESDEEKSDLRFAPPELRPYLSSDEKEDRP